MTRLFRYPSTLDLQESRGTVCTVGSFDGVHRGHAALLRQLVDQAESKSLQSAVVSFYPHPLEVLKKGFQLHYISSLRTNLSLLDELGVDILYLVRFTEMISSLNPSEFIDKILHEKLHCEGLHIGPDLRIGKDRAGTPEVVQEECRTRGWHFSIGELTTDSNGGKIGSRSIRELLREGKLSEANSLLGHQLEISGRVVHGDGRGRTIGFPTANLHLSRKLPMKPGVYAAIAHSKDFHLPAVVNVGVRPTVSDDKTLTVEAHLLSDKPVPCYGERLTLQFSEFIRAEEKFDSFEALKAQIAKDVHRAKELLS